MANSEPRADLELPIAAVPEGGDDVNEAVIYWFDDRIDSFIDLSKRLVPFIDNELGPYLRYDSVKIKFVFVGDIHHTDLWKELRQRHNNAGLFLVTGNDIFSLGRLLEGGALSDEALGMFNPITPEDIDGPDCYAGIDLRLFRDDQAESAESLALYRRLKDALGNRVFAYTQYTLWDEFTPRWRKAADRDNPPVVWDMSQVCSSNHSSKPFVWDLLVKLGLSNDGGQE